MSCPKPSVVFRITTPLRVLSLRLFRRSPGLIWARSSSEHRQNQSEPSNAVCLKKRVEGTKLLRGAFSQYITCPGSFVQQPRRFPEALERGKGGTLAGRMEERGQRTSRLLEMFIDSQRRRIPDHVLRGLCRLSERRLHRAVARGDRRRKIEIGRQGRPRKTGGRRLSLRRGIGGNRISVHLPLRLRSRHVSPDAIAPVNQKKRRFITFHGGQPEMGRVHQFFHTVP